MLFGGTISIRCDRILGSNFEENVSDQFLVLDVPKRLDVNLVLPALAGIIVSGSLRPALDMVDWQHHRSML